MASEHVTVESLTNLLTSTDFETAEYGRSEPKLDSKGRLAIAPKFRTKLDDGVAVSKWRGSCLLVVPRRDFAIRVERMKLRNNGNPEAEDMMSFLINGTDMQHLDQQGRVMIRPDLRDYALLEKDCVINCSGGNELFIWSAEKWAEQSSPTESRYRENGVVEFGF